MLLVTDRETVVTTEALTLSAEPCKALTRTMFDLFAGCGGLSLGFEHAGFTPIFVNELNDDARATYLANRDHSLGEKLFVEHEDLISADVNELDELRLDKVKAYIEALNLGVQFGTQSTLDVLAGGPPCQGYSGIGHRRSYAIDKVGLPSNQLYSKMAEVIESVRPRIFLFENVKGLLSSRWTSEGQKGEIWRDVYGRFKSLGRANSYQVRWKLVYAKDYGVPQNRPRVLIVGIRNDVAEKLGNWLNLDADDDDAVLCGMLPAHGEIAPNIEDIFSDLEDAQVTKRLKSQNFDGAFATLCYPKAAAGKWQKYFRPGVLAERLAPVEEQEYSRHSETVVKKFSCMIKNGGSIPKKYQTKKFAQRMLPRVWGNQGPTITACSLADDYVHYSQPRSLTVREWARLQTFPDTYIFKGKRTTGGIRRAGNPQAGNFDREVPKYTQIGNAVPVKLAEAVAKHFDSLLTKAGF
jgi:DNA (cytosine-5)-methyltransferase 1